MHGRFSCASAVPFCAVVLNAKCSFATFRPVLGLLSRIPRYPTVLANILRLFQVIPCPVLYRYSQETLENHPELAVACAINMQIAMNDINIQNEADGLPHLEMGIAVNTGDVIVGNIGSERRTKYGAVGSQVNFTGRVESFTVGGQILISEATYKALSEKLEIRDVIHVEMKGVPGKVKLYDVKGIKGTHEAKAPDKDETLLQLNEVVTLSVFGMDQKILSGTGKTAVMTHASMMSSKVTFSEEVAKWEDIRMLCNPESSLDLEAEIYGKIISVTPLKDGYEALVRFTSVSAKAYKMLRELLVAGNKTQAS